MQSRFLKPWRRLKDPPAGTQNSADFATYYATQESCWSSILILNHKSSFNPIADHPPRGFSDNPNNPAGILEGIAVITKPEGIESFSRGCARRYPGIPPPKTISTLRWVASKTLPNRFRQTLFVGFI